jgi:hypothetical protein
MGNRIAKLLRHAFHRRQRAALNYRTQPDHPERVPPDQKPLVRRADYNPILESSILTTVDATPPIKTRTKKSTEADSIMTSSIDSLILPEKCSDFYLACRYNKIEEVEKLLENIRRDEIDRIEPNGSTALHAAAFHGHREIVKLLLEAGADRAIKNKYNCLPFDEAADDATKENFLRIPNANRFVSNTGAIEWELFNDDVPETAAEEQVILKSLYDNNSGLTSVEKMFEKIQKNYVEQGLSKFDGIENIKHFFQKATEEQDPTWIIKAYTAQTHFYTILNRDIAGGATKNQNERRYIIAILWHHPKLDPFAYTGRSYRVMQVNDDDLQKYRSTPLFMTKSFLSSSIDRKVAELFVYRQEIAQQQNVSPERVRVDGRFIKVWILCIYHIKYRRTALYIENSSQYPDEGEVLIMPYSVFRVRNVKEITPASLANHHVVTQIELEECQVFDQEELITRH